MSSASLVEFRDPQVSPHALGPARRADTDALGESIAALAARLHAATFELLVLLHEFDERAGWNNGFLSCAHWLHWRTGGRRAGDRYQVVLHVTTSDGARHDLPLPRLHISPMRRSPR